MRTDTTLFNKLVKTEVLRRRHGFTPKNDLLEFAGRVEDSIAMLKKYVIESVPDDLSDCTDKEAKAVLEMIVSISAMCQIVVEDNKILDYALAQIDTETGKFVDNSKSGGAAVPTVSRPKIDEADTTPVAEEIGQRFHKPWLQF